MDSSQDEGAKVQENLAAPQWENFKEIMYDLYIKQGLSLADVRKEMAAHGHNATPRQYKCRFELWGFGKNTTKRDWQAVAILRDRARAAGVDLRRVQIHNRIRRLSELDRHLRKQNISGKDFLKEAMEANVSVPDHVRSIPASVSGTERVDADDFSRLLVGHSSNNSTNEALNSTHITQSAESRLPHSPFDAAREAAYGGSNPFDDLQLQHVYPHEYYQDSESSPHIFSHHDRSQPRSGGMPTGLSMYLAQAANPTSGIMAPGPSFVHLSEMAGLSSVPRSPRVSWTNRGMGRTHGASNLSGHMFPPLLKFHQEIGQTEELDDVGENSRLSSSIPLSFSWPRPVPASISDRTIRYVQTEEHHAFIEAVLMTCMSAAAKGPSQGVDLAEIWMEQAIIKLKAMCANQDPMFLITTHMTLVWLQVHDTESRAESLIEKLSHVTAIELGENSSIAMILESMISAPGKRLPNSRIELAALRGVVHDFGAQLGAEHPHTLVALYYMCFYMMRVHHQFAEAEKELTKLYRSTSKTLGKSSFQSVCVLATLSRAQSRQNKHHAALDTINQCLQEAPLGLNHPHRLEILIRKALMCWSLKDKLKPEEKIERLYWDAEVERLYWIVARGRVATLGRYHRGTESAHETLVEILVENGRYEMDSVKGEAHELLTKPQVAVSNYECWWWTMVPKDREGGDVPPAPRNATA